MRLFRRDRRPQVPGWAVADRPWRDAEFCVVDLETTGLNPRRDHIVSYGAVLVRSGRVVVGTATYGLVRPDRTVPGRSVAVHTLRAVDLVDAPPVDVAADRLVELLTGRALVAHSAWVETGFLGRILARRGVRLAGPVVDTAALARAAGLAPPVGRGEPSLERLAQRLGLPPFTPHHALGDALTTATVLIVLASRLDARVGQTVGSLAALSRSEIAHGM